VHGLCHTATKKRGDVQLSSVSGEDNMKKTLCMALALSMLLLFAACQPRDSAGTVVRHALESVKNMNTEAMKSYWGTHQFKDIGSDEAQALAMTGLIVKNMDYQIIKVDEGKDTAVVTVQITSLDMTSIMTEFASQSFKQMLAYAFLPADQQPTAEALGAMHSELMTTLLTRANNPTVTSTVDICLSLADNKWVITPNADAVDAMLGGISVFSEAMAETSGTDGSGGLMPQ